MSDQLSKHFKRSEFRCKCSKCSFDTVDYKLIEVLEALRFWAARPVKITSGCRCEAHNKTVGGSKKSQHLYGRAADIQIEDIHPEDIVEWLNFKYPNELGVGLYKTWVHLDVRSGCKRWTG
jgi:uncharacterized protein YcbK (DUF882 family)